MGYDMGCLFHRLMLASVIVFALSSCGGGGTPSVDGNNNTVVKKTVTLSGAVSYTAYRPDPAFGLDYGRPLEKPIRAAMIELQNGSGKVLASGNTTATGGYSFTVPVNSSFKLVIKAALGGNPAAPDTQVVDNTSGDGLAVYALFLSGSTGTKDIVRNFNADSGWDGSTYSGKRAAAPFAILDTIYQAQQFVLAADSGISFPPLLVNWSKNNKPVTPVDIARGDIRDSHYNPKNGNLYLLGAENLDTDEYDAHVIVHEWGHYFMDKFSRSDSLGGVHVVGDILDPTVAFDEGFSNAISAMVLNDPVYVDTKGKAQSEFTSVMNVEADAVSKTDVNPEGIFLDGPYSEVSIQELLYDLFDSGINDDDTIGLGFTPLYQVLINGQRTTPVYTSIYSFLYYLKQAYPRLSNGIADLALAENIGAEDEYQDAAYPFYTTLPMGIPVTKDEQGNFLQTWTTFGDISAEDPGNKFNNRLFFKFTAPSDGCYVLGVYPVSPTAEGDLIIYGIQGVLIDQFGKGSPEGAAGNFRQNEKVSFAIGSLDGEVYFAVRMFRSTNPQADCGS